MTIMERAVSLLHGTYFLRPLLLAVLYPMVIYMLIANVPCVPNDAVEL